MISQLLYNRINIKRHTVKDILIGNVAQLLNNGTTSVPIKKMIVANEGRRRTSRIAANSDFYELSHNEF